MDIHEWVRRNARKSERLGNRVLEGLREIGILLMAFGPLEAAISSAQAWGVSAGALFFGVGLALFVMALILEWRRIDAN